MGVLRSSQLLWEWCCSVLLWLWNCLFLPLILSFLIVHVVSVQFSCSFMSDCLRPHGLQHARPPCPSPTLWACSNSCRWCHPTISSSVVPFSSCLQSFPASGSFPISQFLSSGGQSKLELQIQPSVLPMYIKDWFPLGLTCWISLQSKGISRVFSNTIVQKQPNPVFGERKWQPKAVFLPGEFHGQRNLAVYSPWGLKDLDKTEWLSLHIHTAIQNGGLSVYWYLLGYLGEL